MGSKERKNRPICVFDDGFNYSNVLAVKRSGFSDSELQKSLHKISMMKIKTCLAQKLLKSGGILGKEFFSTYSKKIELKKSLRHVYGKLTNIRTFLIANLKIEELYLLYFLKLYNLFSNVLVKHKVIRKEYHLFLSRGDVLSVSTFQYKRLFSFPL